MKANELASIDFAQPSTARILARASAWGWLLAAVGAASCASLLIVIVHFAQQRELREAAMRDVGAAATRHAARAPAVKTPALSPAQAQAINVAVAQLNLPWSEMFDSVEEATPAGIALLSLEPQAQQKSIKGQAQARDSDEMLKYIMLLKKQAFFSDVILTGHETDEHEPTRPLRFQFQAHWHGAAP